MFLLGKTRIKSKNEKNRRNALCGLQVMVSSLPFRLTVLVHKKTKYQATSYGPANGRALKALNLLIAAANQHPFLRLRNFSGMKRGGGQKEYQPRSWKEKGRCI
ncbi:MAG: hypothetical protein Q8P67_20720 [archaeon]|nr:hypothetical protein [archaeon]